VVTAGASDVVRRMGLGPILGIVGD
jgi:hypothetical protein